MGTFIEMPPALGTSEVVRDAYELLVSKHAGQRQRVNGHPYVEHPVLVADDVGRAGFDAEMVAAALLHDIVEDSDETVEEVHERFGRRVADLVDAMTDSTEIEPYERRKALHRRRVAAAGPDATAIFAADKLNNVRALRSAYGEEGEEVAKRFKQPLDTKVQVWVADAEFVSGFETAVPFVEVLEDEVAGLQADRVRARRAG
jgi:guanosine-3',5'-bis(diphosphate) 3'-pyrophosphohydrolase